MSIKRRETEVPDGDPVAHAEALIGSGRASEAAEYLASRIEAGRGGLLARLLLVRAFIASGETKAALALARELARLNPQMSEGALVLGEALASMQLLPAAIAEFQRALRLAPGMNSARLALARVWLDAGEPDRAVEELSRVDDEPLAAELHRRAILMRAQARSDAGYVRHLFDQFSADYDSRMREQLAYAAPEILRALAELVLQRKKDLRILDLGCGTGFAGIAFRDMACRMDGIDLSPAMIERARAKGVYDGLKIDDVETAQAARAYDVVLAADTLVYLGDLDRVFGAVNSCLDKDGFFLFTVEKYQGEGFDLGAKRRWRHSEPYLRDCASAHGFEIAGIVECTPRMEAGRSVEGLSCAMKKAS